MLIRSLPRLARRAVRRLVRRLAAVAMLAVGAAVSSGAHAHPHVWIAYSAQLQMDGHAVVAVSQTWRFTKGFPAQLTGIDALPQNGDLDAKQTAIFRQQAFASLASVSYFNHLFVDGKTQRFSDPDDFHVSIDHGRIVYSFTLKLASPVNVDGHDVALGIWDDSFFVAYSPDKQGAVSLGPQAASTCAAKSFMDHAHPIFNGIVVPLAFGITC
ncbi:ABC-type uncharacterized transport system, substrate-binding protein [Pararobbsia alpina]|uniref:DUF1007 family protein n=1 Tax=Pararobbsia alpina TaxID=621374 RepID=UPI0039A439F5